MKKMITIVSSIMVLLTGCFIGYSFINKKILEEINIEKLDN